jgi:hypothetical protein
MVCGELGLLEFLREMIADVVFHAAKNDVLGRVLEYNFVNRIRGLQTSAQTQVQM